MFVGRAAERARLLRALEQARGGSSSLIALRGEAGIGKTALLEFVQNRARGFRAIRICPLPVQSDLPFSALKDLLTPFLEHLHRLTRAHRAVLVGLLELAPGPHGDAMAIGAATAGLVAAAAQVQPLLLTVDDAQWLDEESRSALRFAAGTIGAERVAVLIAERQIARSTLRSASFEAIEMQGLDDGSAARLIEWTAGSLPPERVSRIITAAAGNPRALIEMVSTGVEAHRCIDLRAGLTPQERQVAAVVAVGATNQEAAAALFLSPKTIEAHLSSIYRKLGLRSRTELAAQMSNGTTSTRNDEH